MVEYVIKPRNQSKAKQTRMWPRIAFGDSFLFFILYASAEYTDYITEEE